MTTRRLFNAAVSAAMWTCAETHAAPGRAAASAYEGPLSWALIAPSQSPEAVRAAWKPLGDRVAQRLGVAVDLQASRNYSDAVKALVEGRAQVAWLSNTAALEAVESGGVEVFATMHVAGPDGQPATGYRAQIVVRDDSPVRGVDDLVARGATFTMRMGDAKSTSGYIIPHYYVFARRGRTPETVFKAVVTGGHAENMAAVLLGEADACTTNDEELKKLAQRDPHGIRRLRVVWTSQEIRQSPLLWRTSLPPGVRTALREVVLGYGQGPAGPQVLAEREALMSMNRVVRFAPSSNRQLLPIADIDLFTARTRLAADLLLSPTQKAEEEHRINRRATRLEILLKRS
jgi:phosphonate transport system substrate-binding protein